MSILRLYPVVFCSTFLLPHNIMAAGNITIQNVPGCSSFTFPRSLQDVATFCGYLQQHIPSYYNCIYYPDLATIQLIVKGSPSQTDVDKFKSAITNYGDPAPVPQLQVQSSGLSPCKSYATDWRTIHLFHTLDDPSLQMVQGVVSAALSADSTTNTPYALRLVDIDSNTILGQATFTNTQYQDCMIPVTAVADNPIMVELQAQKNTAGTYIDIKSLMLQYQHL